MKITKSRMMIAYICSPFLLIHLLFYYFSPSKQKIRSDVGDVNAFIYRLLFDKPYRNVFYYRIGKVHFLFSWILPRCYYMKIRQNMPIGSNFKVEHAYNTFLNAKSIGNDFACWHNVTVGGLGGKIPTIGNGVTMSCGSSVLGGVNIGDNVIIGAGCVVVKDVPSNCTVVGNPAVIVRQDGKKVHIIL